ncbi:MAG: cobalamin-dependent protein, partial [Nitrospiraceae bacterium]
MRVLLISLQTNSYLTGLKYIASNVIAHGHDARILFLPGYMEERLSPEIKRFINDYAPDLIGIGLMSIEYYPSRNITDLLKESFAIPLIWGGVHAIMSP